MLQRKSYLASVLFGISRIKLPGELLTPCRYAVNESVLGGIDIYKPTTHKKRHSIPGQFLPRCELTEFKQVVPVEIHPGKSKASSVQGSKVHSRNHVN